jgi:apolipoprotein N-acyltransferase
VTRQYNAALWIDPAGQIASRYDKMHLVMFGEYVPFVRYWPWLANRTPIGVGVTPGDRPTMFSVNGYRLSPSICFECTVPHLIRRQCRQLAQESGHFPDVLASITDDGWFWGSSILDLHLACAVFRAIEMRRPFVIAANTGISQRSDRGTATPSPRRLPRGQCRPRWPVQPIRALRGPVRRSLLADQRGECVVGVEVEISRRALAPR